MNDDTGGVHPIIVIIFIHIHVCCIIYQEIILHPSSIPIKIMNYNNLKYIQIFIIFYHTIVNILYFILTPSYANDIILIFYIILIIIYDIITRLS